MSGQLAVNMRSAMGPLTGVQRYALEVVKRLEKDSYECLQPDYHLPAAKGHLWEQLVLPRRLEADDLLWSPGNVGPMRIRNQVVTIHDATTFDHPEWFDRKFALWYRFLLPRLARKARGIVTVSEDSKRRLLPWLGVNSDKIRVIHNGVSQDLRPATPDAVEALKARLKVTGKYIAYVGSLEPRKNLDTLLQAWELLASDLKGWELLVAGASGSVFAHRSQQQVPPQCRFVGRLPEEDLSTFLTGSQALVYPSLYEGFGLPPLEAMACGTRVVVSDISVHREVCGAEAEFCDPYDSDAIATSILEVAREHENKRSEKIATGMKKAASYSWERSAEQHRAFFDQVRAMIHVG